MTMTRLQLLEDVVANGYRKITVDVGGKQRRVALDSFTADAMLAVARALNAENQARFLALPWPSMISVGWKLFDMARR